jgi:SAM-dependent methyltransferase
MDKKTSEWTPQTILELSGKYWASFALHAGVELDIFTLLDEEGMTEEEISSELGISRRGAKAILGALSAMHLLVKEGDIYFDSGEAVEYLSTNSPEYLGYMIRHHHYISKAWAGLPDSVRKGLPAKSSLLHEPKGNELEAFEMGMFNNASLIAPRIAEAIDLSSSKSFLDLGGGPGTYAIHFCLKYPNLKAVIFDLPQTRPFAEKMLTRFALHDRIKFVEGDFTKDELPKGFDAVWLSHILHGEGEDTAGRIVRNAAGSLNSGGLFLIHEFILDDEGGSPLFPALFSLNMLVGTSEGKSYTQAELTNFLKEASILDIALLDFTGGAPSRILKGRKAG